MKAAPVSLSKMHRSFVLRCRLHKGYVPSTWSDRLQGGKSFAGGSVLKPCPKKAVAGVGEGVLYRSEVPNRATGTTPVVFDL